VKRTSTSLNAAVFPLAAAVVEAPDGKGAAVESPLPPQPASTSPDDNTRATRVV